MSYHQMQSWPTPEIFVNSQISLASYLTYDAPTCREDIIFTIPSLKQNVLYTLQIASSASGPWYRHIEFALVTNTEQTTKTKVLRINNDYLGLKWFRLLRSYTVLGPEATVIASAIKPLASVIAPPVISLSNLTDVTTTAPGATSRYFGIRALDVLTVNPNPGDISFLIPISGEEDPTCWNSSRYVRPSKKYAGAYASNGFANWGDLLGNLSISNVVTLTGTNARYTIDGSDPASDTPQYAFDGVANNAYATSKAFKCIVRARSFSGSCRSPLAAVVVDKVSPEVTDITTYLIGADKVGICDLDKIENGVNVSSGNACAGQAVGLVQEQNVWPLAADLSALVPPAQGTVPSDGGLLPLFYSITFSTSTTVDGLGWINYKYPTKVLTATNLTWTKPTSVNYLQVAPLHTYTEMLDSGDFDADPDVQPQRLSRLNIYTTVGGSRDTNYFDGITLFDLTGFVGNAGGIVSYAWPFVSDSLGFGTHPFFELHLVNWDLIWTPFHPLVIENYVNAIITQIQGAGVPVVAPPLPGPQPPDPRLLVDIEPWQEYALTNNADAATLNLGNGFAASAWVLVTYISPIGLEPWESYIVGTISLVGGVYVSGPDATQLPLNAGDGFSNLTSWVVPDSLNVMCVDDFESYPLGTMDSYNFNGGTGFASGYVVWPEGADGFEDWESWPVGVITAPILAANGLSGQGMSGVPWVIWVL